MSKDFVIPKVNPLIYNNPAIREMVSVDSINLKKVGERFVYYRGCFSEDTEILGKSGWQNYSQVKVGQKIWTVNLNTERLIVKATRKGISKKLKNKKGIINNLAKEVNIGRVS